MELLVDRATSAEPFLRDSSRTSGTARQRHCGRTRPDNETRANFRVVAGAQRPCWTRRLPALYPDDTFARHVVRQDPRPVEDGTHFEKYQPPNFGTRHRVAPESSFERALRRRSIHRQVHSNVWMIHLITGRCMFPPTIQDLGIPTSRTDRGISEALLIRGTS